MSASVMSFDVRPDRPDPVALLDEDAWDLPDGLTPDDCADQFGVIPDIDTESDR